MKRRDTTILSFILIVIVILIAGYFYWSEKNSTEFTQVNAKGETKTFTVPSIPGVQKQSEDKGDCFHKVYYDVLISQVSPKQTSPQIISMIQPKLEEESWEFKKKEQIDGFWSAIYKRDNEKLTVITGAKGNIPTVELYYELVDCE